MDEAARTYLFPGMENNWRADVPITEKVVWTAVTARAIIVHYISLVTLLL
jgi:hypothetical protein